MKKGIMVDFLTTVLLAIIIFVPTCYALSKIFILSDQAKDSFGTFVQDVEQFAKDENKLSTTAVLIMDEMTSVVLYDQKESKLAFVEGSDASQRRYVLPFPEQHCAEVPCLCLCRKIDFEQSTPIGKYDPTSAFVLSRSTLLSEGEVQVYETSCLLQVCQALPEVKFKEAFTLFRGKDEVRRQVVNLKKENGLVAVQGKP